MKVVKREEDYVLVSLDFDQYVIVNPDDSVTQLEANYVFQFNRKESGEEKVVRVKNEKTGDWTSLNHNSVVRAFFEHINSRDPVITRYDAGFYKGLYVGWVNARECIPPLPPDTLSRNPL